MLNNIALKEWAKSLLAEGAKYWYGTCVQKASYDLLAQKSQQYPAHYTAGRMATYKAHVGQKRTVCDCVGMIKGFFWTENGAHAMKYKLGCPDVSANGMIDLCTEKGDIKTLPEQPGVILWRSGHVGVYVGNSYAIEARGFSYGVVRTRVADRGWLKWGKLPFLAYDNDKGEPDITAQPAHPEHKTIRKGDKGTSVQHAQELLLKWSKTCLPKYGADGDFGGETDTAVRAFQRAKGLAVDGIIGKNTWAKLEG